MILSDICEAIVDCEHKTAPTSPFGYPSIRTTDIKNGRLDLVNCNKVDEKTYYGWTGRRIPKSGDIILAREAPVGEVGIIPEGEKVCLGQRTVLICPDRSKVVPRYLLYLLITPDIKHSMHSQSAGSTVEHLNMSNIRSLKIPELPSIGQQEAVARVLCALDDKIELNRQMNHTLEAMAQALFKSWFVDFDPVTAKAAGRAPFGMNAGTAAHFPSRFEESEVGAIPEGWQLNFLGDFIEVIHGYAFSGKNFRTAPPGDILLTPGNFKIGGGFKTDKFKYYVGTVPESYVLNEGDLLVTMTDLSKDGDTLGYPAIVPKPTAVRYLHNQRLGKVIIKENSDFSKSHLYCLLCTEDYRNEILASATGSTVKHTSPSRIKAFRFPFPNNKISPLFGDKVDKWFRKIYANDEESITLIALRDLLLPKLMSGEIRVQQAEKLVMEAV